MPSGIVFKVQIGAFRKPVPQEAFSDMSPVMGESVGNGLVRYTAGLFVGFDGAAAAKDQVRDRGYRDAFVVAYRDGKRIPLGEAMRSAGASAQPTRTVAQERLVISDDRTQTVVAERPVVVAAPVPTPIVVHGNDSASILASYPTSAEEIMDLFVPTEQAAAYYDVPGAAPAAQVETIRGLFFTVQVGVYSKPVPLEKIFNITPLNSERTETAKVRYTTGRFQGLEQARVRKDQTVALGVKDAFITAYLNGKRIPVREATMLLEKFGPSILAKP
jgi:epidermal growth factor receptor substrate 15